MKIHMYKKNVYGPRLSKKLYKIYLYVCKASRLVNKTSSSMLTYTMGGLICLYIYHLYSYKNTEFVIGIFIITSTT